MFDKIIPVIRSIRINKKYDDFIKKYYPNQADFMRRSIETMAEMQNTRVLHPCGYMSFNERDIHGVIRYWYGYYLDQQFIVVKNIDGRSFSLQTQHYIKLIEEKLKIQDFETVYYYEEHEHQYSGEICYRGFGKDGEMTSFDVKKLSSEFLKDYCYTLDFNNTNFCGFRDAYFRKLLFNATVEWDTTKSDFREHLVKVEWISK